MYRLYCDQQITRRKRYHCILNEHDEIVYAADTIAHALMWLYDRNIDFVRIMGERRAWRIAFALDRDPRKVNGD